MLCEALQSDVVQPNCWIYVSSDVPVTNCPHTACPHTACPHTACPHTAETDAVLRMQDVVSSAAETLGAHGFEWCTIARPESMPLKCWMEQPPHADTDKFLQQNPLGPDAPSEREIVCELKWRKVYRVMFVKPEADGCTEITEDTPAADGCTEIAEDACASNFTKLVCGASIAAIIAIGLFRMRK